jgi:hypothetical protein
MPDELSDVLVPINKQLALTLRMVVGGDHGSVITSVTTVILGSTTPFPFTVVAVQLGPEHVFNGQSGDPHGTWSMEEDWDGSKAGTSHAVPHGLDWRNVGP